MLANKEYPIGCFIRSTEDLGYTPAPDVYHDLYGPMPFFCDPVFAEFCERFGRRVCAHFARPTVIREWERYFWFTIEFGLLQTPTGRKIFGGGILSSFAESAYALSAEPKVLPFGVEGVRRQEFEIDDFQQMLFLLP